LKGKRAISVFVESLMKRIITIEQHMVLIYIS